jgi:hypothetical protein
MSDKPRPEDDKLPESEADERFRQLVGNLVQTPHKPQDQMKVGTPRRRPRAEKTG